MTYFGFLALFLLPPLLIFTLLYIWDERSGREFPPALQSIPPMVALWSLVFVAVLYTTPWDNYLVATNVWWYDPELVTGIVIGWVPIEEYTFFVLQTLMTGLWTLFFARRIIGETPSNDVENESRGWSLRLTSLIIGSLLFIVSVWLLVGGWKPGTYLGLELSWALLPILLQLGVGADILWRHRKLIFWCLVPPTIYLCIGDAIAIGSGTWTIDPQQSTGLMVGNLPIEEIIFFLLTNLLVVFGLILVIAQESVHRMPHPLQRWLQNKFRQERPPVPLSP